MAFVSHEHHLTVIDVYSIRLGSSLHLVFIEPNFHFNAELTRNVIEVMDRAGVVQPDMHQTLGDSAVTGTALKGASVLLTRCLQTLESHSTDTSTSASMNRTPACLRLLYTTLSSVRFDKYALNSSERERNQAGRKRKRMFADALTTFRDEQPSPGIFSRVRHLYSGSVTLI